MSFLKYDFILYCYLSVLYQLDKRNGTSLFPYVVSYENENDSFVLFDILDEFPKKLQFSIEYVK